MAAGKPVFVETRQQGKLAETCVRDQGRGLYILQEMLSLSGEMVRAESELGNATFIVELPITGFHVPGNSPRMVILGAS